MVYIYTCATIAGLLIFCVLYNMSTSIYEGVFW